MKNLIMVDQTKHTQQKEILSVPEIDYYRLSAYQTAKKMATHVSEFQNKNQELFIGGTYHE